ncbi:hypothetical protein QWY20_05440 [Alkalimonas sp. MEB108]|uniref:Uncharacterized protein n=1 Tax=Alkalimonas cellulosilytica TaxID=3058395 RepID=A0ABU7J3E2_9GAMM|nr:hypothetical protein [Alkalimonas sp. MEB108]MEE2000888.1 hypothetical protein [Alkalimonas sp. MEB108]
MRFFSWFEFFVHLTRWIHALMQYPNNGDAIGLFDEIQTMAVEGKTSEAVKKLWSLGA